MSEYQDLKALIEKQGETFEAFNKANDERHAEIKRLGQATADTEDKVEKINKALDKVGDEIKAAVDAANARMDEIEKAAQRPGLAGKTAEQVAETRKEAAVLLGKRADDVTDEDVETYGAYTKGFNTYIRKAADQGGSNLGPDTHKALSAGSDPDGGYWVPTAMLNRIVSKVWETGPMRQVAGQVTISTDGVKFPIDNGEAGASWVSELGARSETSTPQLGEQEIRVHELYAYPRISQRLLDDAAVNVEAWLADKVADQFTRKENTAFMSGTGTDRPKGLLSRSIVSTGDDSRAWGALQYIASGKSADFADTHPTNALYDLVYALKTAYRGNARFMMNRATVGKLRKERDGDGRSLWQPNEQAGQPATLLGYPVTEGEDMPDIEANSYAIAFGDFRQGYLIVDRIGIRTLRDPYSAKPYIEFYSTKRVGGDVVNSEAIKLMKFASS